MVEKKETSAKPQHDPKPQKAALRDFQPLSSAGSQVKKGNTFQQATFRQIDTTEMPHVKGKPKNEFQIQTWERVAPDRVKRRNPKRD